MKNLKRILSLVTVLVIFFHMTLTVFSANGLGVTFTATLDKPTIKESTEDQTVTLTVKTNKPVDVDTIGGTVLVPSGISLTAVSHDELTFTAGTDYYLATGKLAYSTPDSEVVTVDQLAVITYKIPANTPAGTYELGLDIDCLATNFGMNVWEDDATAKATLTIEEAELEFESTTTVILPEPGKALKLIAVAYDEYGRQLDCVLVTVEEGSDVTSMDIEWNKVLETGWTLGVYALDQLLYVPLYGDAEMTVP